MSTWHTIYTTKGKWFLLCKQWSMNLFPEINWPNMINLPLFHSYLMSEPLLWMPAYRDKPTLMWLHSDQSYPYVTSQWSTIFLLSEETCIMNPEDWYSSRILDEETQTTSKYPKPTDKVSYASYSPSSQDIMMSLSSYQYLCFLRQNLFAYGNEIIWESSTK